MDAILCIDNVSSTSGNQPQAIELMRDTGSAFSVPVQFTYNALEACCFLSLGYIYVRNSIPVFDFLQVNLRLLLTIAYYIQNYA